MPRRQSGTSSRTRHLTSADVGNLEAKISPVLVAMSCVVGQFATPGHDCVGEELVNAEKGGAVAVWAAAGLNLNPESSVLNRAFAEAMPKHGEARLGDLIRSAHQQYKKTLSRGETTGTYNLLGDPALKMK